MDEIVNQTDPEPISVVAQELDITPYSLDQDDESESKDN